MRSEKLKNYEDSTKKALEERNRRYRRWKALNTNEVPLDRGSRLGVNPKVPPTPTESTLVAAYDRTDLTVRQWISKAEVARYSFKQKVIDDVEAISLSHQHAIDSMGKCLKVFAESQQACAGSVNAGATRLVHAAGSISGSHTAGTIHGALTSEAQDISTTSLQYVDPEYPTAGPHPIIYGFSLPAAHFSRTPSTEIVVKVFRQMVSYVRDHQAWDEYVRGSTSSDGNIRARFCDLERSWTGNEARDQALFSSLGPSTCANLIKALLASFTEPLIKCPTNLFMDYDNPGPTLSSWMVWGIPRVPSYPSTIESIVRLLAPVYKLPQGEMLRALCDSLVPLFGLNLPDSQTLVSESFSGLLTRNGPCIKNVFPTLVTKFRFIIEVIEIRNKPQPRTVNESGTEAPSISPPPYTPDFPISHHPSENWGSNTLHSRHPPTPVQPPLAPASTERARPLPRPPSNSGVTPL